MNQRDWKAPPRGREPGACCRVHLVDRVGDLGVAVVVGVLGEGAVFELEEHRERSKPGFQGWVRCDRVQVGPVASSAEPEVFDAEAVTRFEGAELVASSGAFDHDKEEEVVVAQDGAGVAAGHREAGGCGAAAGAGLAALEEVAEEDGVDFVLGVGLERFAEAVDVTLDVADDQGGSGHGVQDTSAGLVIRPRRLGAFGRRGCARG